MMLDEFCEYLRQQGKSENTVKAYCQGMKEYMRWHEETFGKEMKVLLRANVLDYISYLRTVKGLSNRCLLYTDPSPRDRQKSRMPSFA